MVSASCSQASKNYVQDAIIAIPGGTETIRRVTKHASARQTGKHTTFILLEVLISGFVTKFIIEGRTLPEGTR